MQRQGRGRSLKDSLSGGELARLRANDATSHRQLADLRNFKPSNFCYLGTRYEIGDRHRRSKYGRESERVLSIRAPNPISPLGGKATGTKLHLHHKCPPVGGVRRVRACVARAARRSLKQSFSQRPWPHGGDHAGRTHISSKRV